MSMFNKGLPLGVILIAASFSAHGTFYKWVDANGVTQYTQTPPPSGQYQEMHSPPPPSGSTAEQTQQATTAEKQDPPTDSKETPPPDPREMAKQLAAREQNCHLAQQRLTQLENHARLRYKAEDGTIHVMSEEEKQAKLIETRKMAEEMCQ